MDFFVRAQARPSRLGILSGAFHPPTRAHLALAYAALEMVDEVLFVLPRIFPHRKSYERVGLKERVRMLKAALQGEPRYSIASTEGGLFIEIARECRTAYGRKVELDFICGRDAAERIVNWDYGRPGAFPEMLKEFGLLVAPRSGRYIPPAELQGRIRQLPLSDDYEDVSGTEVRRRIESGLPWEDLVPEEAVPLVKQLYLPSR